MQLNEKITDLLQVFKTKVLENVTFVNSFLRVLTLGLFVFGAISILNLKTEYSLKQFYPMNHPLLMQEEKLRALFQSEKNLSLLLVLKTENGTSWLMASNFELLQQIHSSFSELSTLKSVVSMSSIQVASTTADEISVGNIFDKTTLSERKKIAKSHPFVRS